MALKGIYSRLSYAALWRCNENEKEKDGYISTREAGKMLGLAMSRVSRYFDRGFLQGKSTKLPIYAG